MFTRSESGLWTTLCNNYYGFEQPATSSSEASYPLLAAQLSHHWFADGVSLELLGLTLPNNSFVDFDDVLKPEMGIVPPPDNRLSPLTLQCLTDLVDCCNSPYTQCGEWYYPNGTVIDFGAGNATFRRNRGPNGPHGPGGQMVYSVVRLWRRGIPPERGRFRCEIPNAANSSVSQILYAHIHELKLKLNIN